MHLVKRASSLFAAIACVAALAVPALAEVSGESIQGNHGPIRINLSSGQLGTLNVQAGTNVYDNTASSALFAVSSTDLASIWGDELLTTGSGFLDEHVFTIFNSGSSAGPLLTANVTVQFFNAVTSASLGAYNTNVNFGTGIPPGFFSLVTVTGLTPLLIDLNVTDIIVTQTVTAKTGTANRLGIVSLSPPTVGTSPTSMFISSTTIGPPGFYTFSNGPADPGHRVAVIGYVTPTRSTSWGRVKSLYR
jgi:hypothetical protein